MPFDKCPQCGHTETQLTVKPVNNVMNKYINKKGDKAIFNMSDASFTDKNNVEWTIVSSGNKVNTDKPLVPLTPTITAGLTAPVPITAGDEKTGVATGAVIKGK